MVSRRVFGSALALLVLAASCEKVPLLAPTGSTITLTTATNIITTTGTAQIVAQVLEASGTPPHSGTLISFTTTLGKVDPAEAETDASGRAVVVFSATGASGTATITAVSGGASTGANSLKLSVGTAAVGAVRVSANPATVSALGGSTTITANVLDVNGNALPQVPVVFSTTTGSLTAAVVTTTAAGIAETVLTTGQQATVTASVGAQGASNAGTGTTGTTGTSGTAGGTTTTTTTSSGQASASVTVTVSAAPTLVITPPTTSPSSGIPSQFTFAVTVPTNGAAVRSLRVDWGDGSSQDLGTVTGNAVVTHTYNRTGSYTVTGTLTDASGNVQTVATAVNVVPVASPTIIITPAVPGSCVGSAGSSCQVTFQLQVTPPTSIGILSVDVDFGASASPRTQGLGGLTGSAQLSTRYPAGAGTQTVTVTVVDTLGRTTQGFTTVSIP